MIAYAEKLGALSRTPVTVCEIVMDFCGRRFGIYPCAGTGTPCYNTYATCKSRLTFLRGSTPYRFVSAGGSILKDLPARSAAWGATAWGDIGYGLDELLAPRPYLLGVDYFPCEIKDNWTVNSRIKITLADEPDHDVGVDPYLRQRSSISTGLFWRKFLARNINLKGRYMRIFEGFAGVPWSEFQASFFGKIDNATLGAGQIVIEAVDLLKALGDLEVPAKLDIKLAADITAAQTQMTLSSASGLDSAGYIRIGDEIIGYAALSAAGILSGCTRGALDTTADVHKAKDKAQKCRYFPPMNPFDILLEMLSTDAALPDIFVDVDAFAYWKAWGGEIDFTTCISEPTKLSQLFFEIVDIMDCKCWVAENLKITIAKNLPTAPGRAYVELTDDADILAGSISVDLNEASRLTRQPVYWELDYLKKADEAASFSRLDIAQDVDAESPNEIGEVKEEKIFCRWIRTGYLEEELVSGYVAAFAGRRIFNRRDPRPLVDLMVELKNAGLITGDCVKLSSAALLDADGTPLKKARFQVVKREKKDAQRIALSLLKLPEKRACYIAPDDSPDYDDATDEQKEYGFIVGDDGLISGNLGYFII